MIFDTHAHVLSADLDRYPHSTLRGGVRPPVPRVIFPVGELVAAMDREGVERACLVQRATLYGYDNRYMLDAAARYPDRFRSVAVLDAQDPSAPAALAELVRDHHLSGLRIVAPGLTEHDTDWLESPQSRALWSAAEATSLPVAVILYRLNNAAGRAAMLRIATRFTGLPIILDHCGIPHASTPETQYAASQGIPYSIAPPPGFGLVEALAEFAGLPHVYFKVTDINFDRLAEAGYDSAAFLRKLVDLFGPERVLWGSDVGQSPAPYGEKIARLHHAASELGDQEREAFLGGNASWIYG